MSNSADRLFNIIRKTNDDKSKSGEYITLKVKEPYATLIREDGLEIPYQLCIFNKYGVNMNTPGDLISAIELNDGQRYFLINNMTRDYNISDSKIANILSEPSFKSVTLKSGLFNSGSIYYYKFGYMVVVTINGLVPKNNISNINTTITSDYLPYSSVNPIFYVTRSNPTSFNDMNCKLRLTSQKILTQNDTMYAGGEYYGQFIYFSRY